MSKQKSNLKKLPDSVANALHHLKEYNEETQRTILKAITLRNLFKKHFGKQIVQVV